MRARGFSLFIATLLLPSILSAKDLGTLGNVWPLAEQNLIEAIKQELGKAQADGRIETLNKKMANRTKSMFYEPPPIVGLEKAAAYRKRYFDPSIIVERDIYDHEGKLIIAKGKRVNPLDTINLGKALLFIDGREEAQVSWALKHANPRKIILVAGAPKLLMDEHKTPFYYDQHGKLVERFMLARVPSRLSQQGNQLLIEEVPPLYQGDRP